LGSPHQIPTVPISHRCFFPTCIGAEPAERRQHCGGTHQEGQGIGGGGDQHLIRRFEDWPKLPWLGWLVI